MCFSCGRILVALFCTFSKASKLICQSAYCIVLISKVVFQDGYKCSIEPFYPCLSMFFLATYCYVPDVKLSCMSVLNFH